VSSELPLFIYGSLLDPNHRAEIIGRPVAAVAASLHGYERGKRRYWFIRPCGNGTVEGAILTDLTAADIEVLDRYEEVPRLYTRELVTVTLADGSELECQVYLPTGWERD
jgi:gamma-glutamylcyclotransferase (GGCT)/AIG2-like uncharacterized protein YtfP